MVSRPAIILHRVTPRSYCKNAWALNYVMDNGSVFHACVDNRARLIDFVESDLNDPAQELTTREAIAALAVQEGKSPLVIVTMLQSAAAATDDEFTLEALCEIKAEMLDM